MLQNPILPGFYPDPSICRVGDDFYVATSSFSFFPGVPIFHSKDLANWEQLGYALDRQKQLSVSYHMLSGGIAAPSIRYHEGTFYVITTNMSMGFKNFIVTAQDPKGPWSDIHIIEGADGIDPSLFFDDDGKVYYTGTTRLKESDGNSQAIWCCEIDLQEMKLVGERSIVWKGSLRNAYSPEGPHLYKKDGWYYLMIAEGGTEHFHAVTISRSKVIMGEYEGYLGNPILTHSHLGKNYPICNVGHADLVELQDGSWYMVALASRLMNGYHKILGRETFIAPVVWEDGWPVVSLGTGKLEPSYPQPACLALHPFPENSFGHTDTNFDEETLGLEWNFIGAPKAGSYKLENSCLKLQLLKQELVPWEMDGLSTNVFERLPSFAGKEGFVSFVGRRQQHMRFTACTKLIFSPEQGESAGLVVLQNDANQLRLELRLNANGEREVACLSVKTVCKDGKQFFEEQLEGEQIVTSSTLFLKIVGDMTKYSFYASNDGLAYFEVAKEVCGAFLGSETSGGFIGAYLGMFASGGAQDKDKQASFDLFTYIEN